MRLNRFLASAGLGSRRSVEELIRTEQVRINGRVVTDLATKVSPDDAVKVGSRLLHQEKTLTAVLNKPRGFVCTASDDLDRRTIFDLLPPNWPRVFHVGRLDKDSEGLLIVTNDGDLSLALTHPRYKIDKEYEVLLDKPFVPTDRAKLLKGFHIMGGRAKIEHLEQLGPMHLKLTLNQGIKRQIRLMLYELGYEVERLVRVRIGVLKIGETRPGDWRILTPKEIATLKSPETAPATRGLGARPKGAPVRKFPHPALPAADLGRKEPRPTPPAPHPPQRETTGPRPAPARKPVGAPTGGWRAPGSERKRPSSPPPRREREREGSRGPAPFKAHESQANPQRRFSPRPDPRRSTDAPSGPRREFSRAEKSGPPRDTRPPQRKPSGPPAGDRRAPRPHGKRPPNAPRREERGGPRR